MEKEQKKGLSLNAKSFITAIFVIFVLMVVSYILTFVIKGGRYERFEDGTINPNLYETVKGGLPFWKWALSPVLVLGADGSSTLIAVIIFLIVIGGVFNSLNSCGLMEYMVNRLSARFYTKRYILMAVIMLFFMSLGSLIGSFEECVPLVPIVVALAINLGFDALTGVAMSLLAVGCGFAAGVLNPFTVGVAQQLAGLQMFSGAWLRLVAFVIIYGVLFAFVYLHAKRIAKPVNIENFTFEESNKKLRNGTVCFGGILGVGILIVLLSSVVPALQDYTMIIVAVMFLVAGIVASLVSGMKIKTLLKTFLSGIIAMLPAVLMILMASSIKFILQEANVMDSMLHGAVSVAEKLPKWVVILFIYLIVLVMNFFIASGSAKAFMLIPLIVPLAGMFQIPSQLCIMAFAFGDGFSNVFYPTNPVLLISLGVAEIDYGKWFKWTWKFQLINFVITSLILLFGLAIGYGI